MTDLDRAIKRVEESRQTHVDWINHLAECHYCKENPPQYVQTAEQHKEIVAGYDLVLDVLAGRK